MWACAVGLDIVDIFTNITAFRKMFIMYSYSVQYKNIQYFHLFFV